MKVTPQQLKERLAWPLDLKLEYTCKILSQFIIHMKGDVYLSFSAGKDSQTLAEIIDRIWDGSFKHITPNWERLVSFKKPVKLYSNTGLEFPEIVEHAKTFDDVTIVKPLMGFTKVISEIGVAIGSKKTAMMIRRLKGYISNPSETNQATKNLYLTGYKKDGTYSATSKLPNMWHKLLDAPFKVSDQCCDILKKEPFRRFEKETGLKPIVGTTTSESSQRTESYQKTGCNSFEEGKEKSRPLSIWTEKDVWDFAKNWNIKFASVYYDRIIPVEQIDGSFIETKVEAETGTGCMWCMFGIHLEDKTKNNRIQRIAISHPKLHNVIINKCGLGDILNFINIPFLPKKQISCGKQTTLFNP